MLICTGSEETHPRMLDAGRDMHELAKGKNPDLRWLHVEGGDHGLRNNDEVFMEALLAFLAANKGTTLDKGTALDPLAAARPQPH